MDSCDQNAAVASSVFGPTSFPLTDNSIDGFSKSVLISDDVTVVEITQPEQLGHLQREWNELAAHALDPNVFMESWFFRPAVEEMNRAGELRFLFVYQRNKRQTDPPILCGFFPLERKRLSGTRSSHWEITSNIYSYLTTPLVHPEFSVAAMSGLIGWCQQQTESILGWPKLQSEGAAWHSLNEVLNQAQIFPFILDEHSRAFLLRERHLDDYVLLNGHNRRDLRRLMRKLGEKGQVEFRQLNQSKQIAYWQDHFLRLEQMGWKGENGTAISQDESHAMLFRKITSTAWENDQLQMLGMFLSGEPIAMKCNLLSGRGSFAWKIAYDEEYRKFSPGVQLELENIRVFHEETELDWMDSCATPGHSMINRLWRKRRGIHHLLIPTGKLSGQFYCAIAPLIRFTKRRLKKIRAKKK